MTQGADMLSFTLPVELRKVASHWQSTQKLGFSQLCGLLAYFFFGCRSLSEAVRWLHFLPSVSTLQRTFDGFESNRALRRMRASVLKKLRHRLKEDPFWCYAVDDTHLPHCGKSLHGCHSWGRHGGGYIKGQRVLVLCLVVGKQAYPLASVLCYKKDEEGYQKPAQQLAILLDTVLGEGFPPGVVTLDSWFDGVEILNTIESRGCHFVCEAKGRRKAKTHIRSFFQTWSQIFFGRTRDLLAHRNKRKWFTEALIWIRKRHKALKAVAIYNRKNAHFHFAIYITSKRSLTGVEIWTFSRKRWHIEEVFRGLKQNLSFGKLPCSSKNAVLASISIPFLLWNWILLNVQPQESLDLWLKQARKDNFIKSLFHLNTRNKDILMKNLFTRLSKLNSKPVISAADHKFHHAA